ncbi:hypothetical protein HDU91_006094 [Kappamyces sp. JEL0680]|nr:hypothetical protein HDU91_006094 [Kappamyces sp. JEL0680]
MAKQPQDFKVVIIGGGLVGALAAVYFGNRGYSVSVYEKRNDIRERREGQGRSINLALSTRGIEALKGAGVEDAILPTLLPMKGRLIHALSGDLSSQPYGIFGECINSVDRKLMNERLLTAAEKNPHVQLHFEWAAEKIDFASGVVTLVNAKKSTKTIHDADLIIGADGAYSKVRQQFMRSIRLNYSQEYIDHAYVELNMPPLPNGDYAMDSGHLHIWPRHTFMMIALPNLDHSFTVTLFMPWAKFEAITTPLELERFFTETFPDAVPLIGLELLVKDYFKNEKGSLMTVKCKPYNVGGKAVIIGDAAHAMVPFYGQGMNCGFEDVLILDEIWTKHSKGNSIPSASSVAAILDEYSAVRNPDAEAMCDLALHNYVEMRSSVVNPDYLLRKKVVSPA